MKIVTYGAMHLGVAFGVAYALTGRVRVAGALRAAVRRPLDLSRS
ncbi:MAG: DUF2061 domain-containing protein [Burkholderiales bacterium]|nr:DUF2061 domain-containing protein [Burkholderiales bacterium]